MEERLSNTSSPTPELCAAVYFAMMGEKTYFPVKPGELVELEEVTLKMKKGEFLRFQKTATDLARKMTGNYERTISLLQQNVSKKQWDEFTANQAFAQHELESVAGGALFGKLPVGDEWLTFDRQDTEIRISLKTAKAIIQGLTTHAMECRLQGEGLPDEKREFEYAFASKTSFDCVANILSQLNGEGIPINLEELYLLRQKLERITPVMEEAKWKKQRGS